ncbi:hypothetical protein EB118_07255 [bacterium]|nr:hypothetical protein [bacterium]NDC94450.1 hypothetical protein [bacterium]NDD84023.1 hypothetical protein [bacterium]NDG29879.1 hypothetical protein [bacterium]
MQAYFKQSNKRPITGDIDFQIIEWWAQDEPGDDESDSECDCDLNTDTYKIRCFGVTKEGVSVTCAITGFQPFYYVKVSKNFTQAQLNAMLRHIDQSYYYLKAYRCKYYNFRQSDAEDYRSQQDLCKRTHVLSKGPGGRYLSHFVTHKDLFGFRNGESYKFVKLIFDNYTAMCKSRYLFKRAISIDGVSFQPVKYKLYESNFEPHLRYCHIKDILMAGWIRLPNGKYTVTRDTASTQVEVTIDHNDIVSLRETQDMARFLQASFDIEVYSEDDTFPDPKRSANVVYQIATTYKYYSDPDVFVKHLLTLKTCAPINDPKVVVECCRNEKELIRKWVHTINKMDPDILYTYNGDSFDCRYLKERAQMCGIDSELFTGLSRLTHTRAQLKTEYFSSSAYGDSEFHRVYIPGRLNYDLLIHYKRGMKKYPSYKLDYIANEILKEGKDDVSAKQIFEYYRDSDPEKIRHIGLYCIRDTFLLQRLVDKQLILTNIIQLANVTFVPIGFLTTRGQTIKVFSQVIRKARQMDFLVPHTNFNENNFPVQVRFAREHGLTDDAIGKFVDIVYARNKRMDGKISEVVSDTEIVVLSGSEIDCEYKDVTLTYDGKRMHVLGMYPSEDAVSDSFTGATVLEPLQGHYTDNVAVLDFASLYPCVEISRNLCYSTLVMDPKYSGLQGVNYETIEWNDSTEYKLKHTCTAVGKSGKSKGLVCGKQAYFEIGKDIYVCRIHDPHKKTRPESERFQKRDERYSFTIVQPSVDPQTGQIVNKGVVPAMLEELYSERKKVKRQMAKAADEGNKLLEDILNSTQLAIKVSLNSTYGFVSRNRGNLILKPLGQLTTAIGRMLIEQSKHFAETEFCEHVNKDQLVTHKLSSNPTGKTAQQRELELLKYKVDLK